MIYSPDQWILVPVRPPNDANTSVANSNKTNSNTGNNNNNNNNNINNHTTYTKVIIGGLAVMGATLIIIIIFIRRQRAHRYRRTGNNDGDGNYELESWEKDKSDLGIQLAEMKEANEKLQTLVMEKEKDLEERIKRMEGNEAEANRRIQSLESQLSALMKERSDLAEN